MSLPIRAQGVTREAHILELELGLFEDFYPEVLDWFVGKLCNYYDLPSIPVTFSPRLGSGNYRITTGIFRITRDRQVVDIRLGPQGCCTAVAIHEFAHYITFCERGTTNHRGPFQRAHLRLLQEHKSNRVVELKDFFAQQALEWFWRRYQELYLIHHRRLVRETGRPPEAMELISALNTATYRGYPGWLVYDTFLPYSRFNQVG